MVRTFFILFVSTILVASSFVHYAHAIMYNPGETLAPNCAPTDVDCGVRAPVFTSDDLLQGGLLVATSSGWSILPAGSDDYVLTLSGGTPTWMPRIADDSLDFSDLKDSLALDASTDIALDNAETLSITNTGTGNSFAVYDEALDNSPFVIDALGNVGIGTNVPSAKLHVSGGDANINGITIGLGGGQITSNSALGASALFNNTTGIQNTANGRRALYSNTTGYSNTAIGQDALYSNTTGYNNTANGVASLFFNTIGNNNTANGVTSLYSNTTGSGNTANGVNALRSNTTGYSNTASGVNALYFNTTGYSNTANGVSALRSNTAGNNNTANGLNSLFSSTTGSNNTANGVASLFLNTTGNNNTANGVNALRSNTTGNNNIANGVNALYSNTTGSNNTANGVDSLYFNTTGNYNTANGVNALRANTAGSNNLALGFNAGRYISSGADASATDASIFIGRDTRPNGDNQTNQIVIGDSAIGIGDNSVVLGNDSILTTALKGNVGIGTDTPLYKLDVVGGMRLTDDMIFSSGKAMRFDANNFIGHTPSSTDLHVTSGGSAYLNIDSNNNTSNAALIIATDRTSTSGGTELMRVSENGNVGIGTTSPTSKLFIEDVNPVFTISATANNRKITLDPGSGALNSVDTALNLNRFSGMTVSVGSSSPSHLRVGQATEALFGSTALMYIGNTETNTPALVIDKAPGATVDIMQVRSSTTTNGDIFTIDKDGNIGIGTTATAGNKLRVSGGTSRFDGNVEIVTTSTSAGFMVTGYASGSSATPQNIFRQASGTGTSPLASTNSMSLGAFSFRGHTGTQWTGSKAYIQAKASEQWSETANGTAMSFSTTPNGSTTMSEKMRITGDGYIGIGNTTPVHGISLASHTDTDSAKRTIAIGATPALYIPKQGTSVGDLDGSIAVGNGLRSLSNTTGSEGRNNVSVGLGALMNTTTGISNVGVGSNALSSNTTGGYNVAIGPSALRLNTTGVNSTAIGLNALYNNTVSYNTAIGSSSASANTTGTQIVAVGHASAQSNTTGGNIVAIGSNALLSNTIGSDSTAVGTNALRHNTAGQSTAVGSQALYANTTGSNNTALGFVALYSNTTGSLNVALGSDALRLNTTGSYNVASGYRSLRNNTTGSHNIGIGLDASYYQTAGSRNISIGSESGLRDSTNTNVTTSNNSLFLGSYTKPSGDGQTNQIVIGDSAVGIGSNSVVLGNDSILTTALKGSVGIGGVTTPTKRLTIYTGHTANANEGIVLTRGSTVNSLDNELGFRLKSDGSGNYRGAITSKTSATSEIEAMTFRTNGNVGIGAINPLHQLHVLTSGVASIASEGATRGDVFAIDNGAGTDLKRLVVRSDGGALTFGGENDAITNFRASMTILAGFGQSGNVGIGTTTPSNQLTITNTAGSVNPVAINVAGNGGIAINRTGVNPGSIALSVNSNGKGVFQSDSDFSINTGGVADRFFVSSSGNIGIGTTNPTERLTVFNGSTTGTYTTSGWVHSSDERLKTNIQTLTNALNLVQDIEGVTFHWKNDPDGKQEIGFIAQDVREVLPQVVVGDEVSGYGISYGNMTALNLQAIKELSAGILDTQGNSPLSTSTITPTDDFGTAFFKGLAQKLVTWLGNARNGITSIFAKNATVETLCVGTPNDKTCITKDLLDSLLHQANMQSATIPQATTTQVSPSQDTTTDTIDTAQQDNSNDTPQQDNGVQGAQDSFETSMDQVVDDTQLAQESLVQDESSAQENQTPQETITPTSVQE